MPVRAEPDLLARPHTGAFGDPIDRQQPGCLVTVAGGDPQHLDDREVVVGARHHLHRVTGRHLALAEHPQVGARPARCQEP